MNVNKLKGKITEKGLNVEKLAAMIGIDRSALYRKLNNAEKITIGEAARMKEALSLSDDDAIDIFFAAIVAPDATLRRCEACEAMQL